MTYDKRYRSPLEGGQAKQARPKRERRLAKLSRGGYDALTLTTARKLRKNQTDAERKLWGYLCRKQLEGLKFRRQQPIGPFIADFYCPEKRLIIEIDGSQHMKKETYDRDRTTSLESQGYRVLRFWNNDVLLNTAEVIDSILGFLRNTPHDSASASGLASSAPPQGGSGSCANVVSNNN